MASLADTPMSLTSAVIQSIQLAISFAIAGSMRPVSIGYNSEGQMVSSRKYLTAYGMATATQAALRTEIGLSFWAVESHDPSASRLAQRGNDLLEQLTSAQVNATFNNNEVEKLSRQWLRMTHAEDPVDGALLGRCQSQSDADLNLMPKLETIRCLAI